MKRFLPALLLILVMFSGCIESAYIVGRGPDLSVSADPQKIFSGEKTTIYVDIENNGEKTYEKVFADVFDIGMLEYAGQNQASSSSSTSQPSSSSQPSLSSSTLQASFSALQPSSQPSSTDVLSNAVTGNVLSNVITGEAAGITIKLNKYCDITGYYLDSDNYYYEIRCRYFIKTNSPNAPIPVTLYYKDSSSGAKAFWIEAYPNLQWNDIQIRASLHYDAINKRLYMSGDAAWITEGGTIRFRYADGRIADYYAQIDFRGDGPSGRIVLVDPATGKKMFGIIPTGQIKNGNPVVAIEGSATYDGTNLYFQMTEGHVRMVPYNRITGQAAETETAQVDATGKSIELSEGTTGTTGSTGSTTVSSNACSAKYECIREDLDYCGSCDSGTCTPKRGTKDVGQSCAMGCECKEGMYCEGVCKAPSKWNLCKADKEYKPESRMISYYYCAPEQCPYGTAVKEKITQPQCESELQSHKSENERISLRCYNPYECYSLGSSGYKCPVCWNGVCFDSDSMQPEGNMCERTCQCLEGRCVIGKTQATTTATSSSGLARDDAWCREQAKAAGETNYNNYKCVDTSNDKNTGGNSCELGTGLGGDANWCDQSKGIKCCIPASSAAAPQSQGSQQGVCKKAKPIEGKCTDGTAIGQCSKNKPYYCDKYGHSWSMCQGPDLQNGTADDCGCPEGKQCLSDGSCGKPNECHLLVNKMLPNAKETLECKVTAPAAADILKPDVWTDVNVRMRYSDDLNAVLKIDVMSPEEYRRSEMKGTLVKGLKKYSFNNRDIQLDVEFTDELPLVARDKDTYVHFTISDIGNGMVYPLKLYEDFAIDQMPEIIDEESCSLNRVTVPDGKQFPKITCKLKVDKNIIYLRTHVVNINVKYAYEMRKSVSVRVVR